MLLKNYTYNLKISRFSEKKYFFKENQTISSNNKQIQGRLFLKTLCRKNVKDINKINCVLSMLKHKISYIINIKKI